MISKNGSCGSSARPTTSHSMDTTARWLSAPVGIDNWPLKRSIYGLGDLRALLAAAIRRYLEFVGQPEDRVPGPQLTTDSENARSRNHSGFASGASNIKRQPSTSHNQ